MNSSLSPTFRTPYSQFLISFNLIISIGYNFIHFLEKRFRLGIALMHQAQLELFLMAD